MRIRYSPSAVVLSAASPDGGRQKKFENPIDRGVFFLHNMTEKEIRS